MKDKNQAVTEAGKMMIMPMNQLPPIALEYLQDLSKRVGFCGEVCLTAYAAYNQMVLGMPCDDSLYQLPQEEKDWFINRGYYKK